MNWLLVILLLAATYFLLEAGLVFFALIVGVALLLGLIASWASSRRENAGSPAAYAQSPYPAPPQFEKQNHEELQKTWMTVGMVFNAIGKGIYKFLRYGFQASGKKYD